MRCLRPITLKTNRKVVPCGNCPHCKKNYAYSWAFRLMQEERYADSALFLTITYDNDNLEYSTGINGSRPTLVKSHLQKFFKRLRYYSTAKSIKYYAVGEYGSTTRRPHYHAIIFNAREDDIELAWSKAGNPIGSLYYGSVTTYSVGYTLKYLIKERSVGKWDKWCRQPEFSVMSQGLGIGYLTPDAVRFHQTDYLNRRYVTMPGNIKLSMPRYYADKLYGSEEKETFSIASELINQSEFYEQFSAGIVFTDDYFKSQQLYNRRVKDTYRRSEFSLTTSKF